MKRKSVREEKTEVSDFSSGKSSFFSWTAEGLIMGLKLNIGPMECSVGLGCDVCLSMCVCVFSEVVLGGMVLADCPGWQISFVDVCV